MSGFIGHKSRGSAGEIREDFRVSSPKTPFESRWSHHELPRILISPSFVRTRIDGWWHFLCPLIENVQSDAAPRSLFPLAGFGGIELPTPGFSVPVSTSRRATSLRGRI